jgi:hypothetical protein
MKNQDVKKWIYLGCGILLVIFLIVAHNYKKNGEASASGGPDLARGISAIFPPSEQEVMAIDAMKLMTTEQRVNSIKRNFPNLERRLISYLKDPRLAQYVGTNGKVTQISYVFADEVKGVKATNGLGEMKDGYIRNELIARVYIEGRKEPFNFIVRCTNGLVDLVDKNFQPISVAKLPAMKFTIKDGQSLCDYVDYATAIQLAENFGLRLSKREIGDQNFKIMLYLDARNLSNLTDRVLVQALVMPGDTFDLENMTMNGKPAMVHGQSL